MKPALLLSTALLASAAQADFIGAEAEAGVFLNNDGEDSNSYFGLAIEHPIPLIPNVRFQHQSLEEENQPDLSFNDYTLYYEFGLLWLDLDLGATFRQIGDSNNSTIDGTYPLGYVSAYLSIPGTPFSVGGEFKSGGGSDADITDTTFKVKFQPLPFVGLEAGYRTIEEQFQSSTVFEPKGAFIGVFADF
ncbi:TIGR04219 family outer membrane beta-barrel protein [Marinomonas sp. C1424]|uniref:TIGR04219 family outer membrane beta-barrel protein n=1 Tax=Marinomonas transparens TaxID=2795388 RepID=A0A934JVY1_9GAMM|nr:TIGR04219 family outer membrane beta-barrel protein [Marinomonas transparens]